MDDTNSESSGRMIPTQREPRASSDLQGLLRFAIEAARDGNAREPTALGPMDEQRRKFLEQVINSLTVDVTEEMIKCIKILSNKNLIGAISVSDDIPETVECAFETTEGFMSQIDSAIGFYKLGGFAVFPVCLSSEKPSIRAAACRLLAEMCQNNPFCQTKVLECGYLRTLIDFINSEQDVNLLSNAMYAVSCIVRHHERSIKELIKDGGLGGLFNVLEKPVPVLRNKAAFLITNIFPDYPDMANDLISSGVVHALVNALPKKRDESVEQLLHAIVTLSDDATIAEEFRSPDCSLKETLLDYLESEELKPSNTDYREEKEYCESLVSFLFGKNLNRPPKSRDANVDR